MNVSQWPAWVRTWFARHPLRRPPSHLQQAYTDEVMRRLEEPAPVFNPLRWVVMPRLVWAVSAVAACAMVLTVWRGRPQPSLVQGITDRPMTQLAQDTPVSEDEAWIEETVELLVETDADDADIWFSPADRVTDEELLEELRRLEELEASDTSHASRS